MLISLASLSVRTDIFSQKFNLLCDIQKKKKKKQSVNSSFKPGPLSLWEVGFSYYSRKRNHCEQPLDLPWGISNYITPHVMHLASLRLISREKYGTYYTTGFPKRRRYVAKRTRKRQNKFYNSFYWFILNLFVLGAGRRLTQRNSGFFFGKSRINQLLAGYGP